jgi:hypothetical protein
MRLEYLDYEKNSIDVAAAAISLTGHLESLAGGLGART